MRDMTQGKPLRMIFSFAVSLLAANLMTAIYSLVDSMMVGRLVASEGIGAIGATSSIVATVSTFGSGIVSGCGIMLGRYWGAGRCSSRSHSP